MATVKAVLDTRRKNKSATYPISIRIIAGNATRTINIGYRVKETQWTGQEVKGHPDAGIINGVLSEKINQAKRFIADCAIKNTPLRIDLIGTGRTSYNFIEYLDHRAKQYLAKEQIIMNRKVKQLSAELKKYFSKDLHFEEIDQDTLRTYDAFLIKAENSDNTRHKKFKLLRQFFQQGIDEGKVVGINPFKSYKIALKPVNKEKLTEQEINAIENLPLNPGPVDDTRNMFLFSYFAKGARFENCLTLLHSQIKGGRINFKTNKGEKYISVKIHPRLQAILNKYKGKGIVFPFLEEIPKTTAAYLRAVDSRNVIVNRHLKTIAALCEIDKNLTFHMARHSFAFHLKQTSNSINVIQDSLGHSDQRTTQIYLKSLGDEVLDKEMDKLYGG